MIAPHDPRSELPTWPGYLLPIGAMAATHFIADNLEPSVFLLAVALSAVLGGLRAGVTALCLSAVGVVCLCLFRSANVAAEGLTVSLALRWASAIGVGVLVCLLTEAWQKARRRGEALCASEDRYRALVEMAPEGIAILQGGRVAFVNPAGARLVGAKKPEDLIGLSLNDYLHPDDLAASAERQVAVLKEQRVLPLHRVRLRRLDGIYVDVETCAGPATFGGAAVIQLIARDVTERTRDEAFLSRQKEVLERIATGAPLPDVLDEITRMVEEQVDDVFCSVLLLEDKSRLRVAAAHGLPAAYNAAIDGVVIGPEVGSCGSAAYLRHEVEVEDIATDRRWANFRELALAHGLRACWSTPIFSRAQGGPREEVLGTFAVYRREPGLPDARYGKLIAQAEHLACVAIEADRTVRELRNSEARFRTFVDHVSDGLFLHDDRGAVVDANRQACESLGYSREELIGKLPTEFDPDVSLDTIGAKMAKLEAGELLIFDSRHRRKDGTTFPVEVRVRPFQSGNRLFALALVRDITDRKHAEEMLRASRAFQEAVIRTAGEGICVCQSIPEFPFLHFSVWNDRMSALTGYTVEEINRLGWYQTVYPDPAIRDRAAQRIAKMREGNDLRAEEWEITRKDGERRILAISTSSVETNTGDRAVVALMLDTTDRKRAEERLKESEQRFAQFMQHLPGLAWIKDLEGRYVFANESAQRAFGCVASELYGKRDEDLFPPETAARFGANDQTALGTEGGTQVVESLQHPNGSMRHSLVNRFPILKPDGSPALLGGVAIDITDRLSAEESLYRKQQLLEEAQAVAHLGCFEWDIANNEVTWTEELYRIYGLNPAEFGATVESFLERVYSEDRARVQATITQAMCEQGAFQIEERIVRADGEIRVLESRGKVVGSEEGRPVRMVGACLDVTDRKRLEQQFHQAQKMEAIGRLAGGVAHDFNNLLTVINGFSELLFAALREGDPNRLTAVAIRDAGLRAARITRQLLAFSRKAIVEPKVLDLNAIVSGSAEMLRSLIGPDIVLTTNLDPALGRIRADPGQIEQVVVNLAVNARDAMPNGGRLTLQTRSLTLSGPQQPEYAQLKPGEYALFEATDTGVGMTEEVKSRLFEPFFTTKDVDKGTGLGLSVVHGVVRQCSGHIMVRSEVGVGTTFTLLFPVTREEAEVEIMVSPSRLASAKSRGTQIATVLLVEDENLVRRVVRINLEALGHTVLEAESGPEAVRLALQRSREIDLLMTDVSMPEMAGPQVARTLRELLPDLRVLYLSGHAEDAAFRDGLPRSGDGFLQKPFTSLELANKVREVLSAATGG